jgi:SOS response regulatory protein OraA/RecX
MNIARHYCDDLADIKSVERCCEKAREKALAPEDFISISDSIMDFSEFDGKRDLAKILILQSLEYEISNPKREELAKKAEDESYLNDTKFAKEIRGFSNPIYDHIGSLPEDIQDKIRNEVVMTEWGPINKLNELVGSSYNDFDICNTDKVLTRQILEISEIFSRSLNDQGNLVENIQSVLNDNDWLTDLFKKQIKLAYNLRDIKQLSSSAMRIKNYLKNDVWAIKIFEDILSFCETSEDYWNYIHGVRGIFGDDAITIPGVSFINNVDTQLKHLEKIAITFSDFIKLGTYYLYPNVNKKELSKKFFKIASTKINLRMDLISMATYATIDFHLGDKVWGKELYETAYNNLSLSSHDIMTIANDVYKEDYLNDREWAKQMYLTAARKAVMSNEEWMLESVIDSVNDEYGFNDPDFAEEIRNTIKIKGSTID